MSLNNIEEKALTTVEFIMLYLTKKTVNVKEYMEIMNRLRTIKEMLINKKNGCDSGLHQGYCTCVPGKEGKAASPQEYQRAKRFRPSWIKERFYANQITKIDK